MFPFFMSKLLCGVSVVSSEYLWRYFMVILMYSGLVILASILSHDRKNVKRGAISFCED